MDNKNHLFNSRDNREPKMPKFNMNWVFIIVAIAAAALLFSGGGNMLASGNANTTASYSKFTQYVGKGYANRIEINKENSKYWGYIFDKFVLNTSKVCCPGGAGVVRVLGFSVDGADRLNVAPDNVLRIKRIERTRHMVSCRNQYVVLK